jgi:hypothetical protein
MALYLRRERLRLLGTLNTVPPASTAALPTQPLAILPLPSQPDQEEDLLSSPRRASLKETRENSFDCDDSTQLPEFNESPIHKPTVPKVVLKTVPNRSTTKVVKKANKYDSMDWEEINTYLHGVYGHANRDGYLNTDNLDCVAAEDDYDALRAIDNRDPSDLYLIGTWIKKLKTTITIMQRPYSDSEDDERDSF